MTNSGLFSVTVDDLCIREPDESYEKGTEMPKPNVRFMVRICTGVKEILNWSTTGDLPDEWQRSQKQQTISFVALTSSVILLGIL